MNPFERWDDWEWERAIQEVGKEQGRGKSTPRNNQYTRHRNPVKKEWGNFLNHWNGTQKRTFLAAMMFLMVFFSANSSDQVSLAVHSIYRGAMDSGNYYTALNNMAKEALSLGGVPSESVPVDLKMKGKFLPPISGPVMAGFGDVGSDDSVHQGLDVGSALGIPVITPAGGVVTIVGVDPQLGKIVKIDFGDGWTTVLGNLGEIKVDEGQRIEKGQVVGTVGLSAPLKKPWLHFELRKNNQPVNPIPYLVPPEAKN
ncbi:murein hydrolase activator EnvC family protein [Desulfosporosinus shakirovi]|uniref:murein hydrolase activator EnvC family protein n=1 Tax=Desulfosporosinus shakirovi TaxID=2885154 RepID=UPI001E31CB4B|nr:M23 family metallopeptidase [Desulfosporosinus sp. SRJS8]MCB8817616.1 M23 family metallopeptidase [Desulfosporosinus sp. SRJS8]